VKFTVVLAPEEIEESDGTTKAPVWTENVCGARFLPLIVKEWKADGLGMVVKKGKKLVVPKTEWPVADSDVRTRGLMLEEVVRVRIEGADAEVAVSIC
jgi:hypothetical protein